MHRGNRKVSWLTTLLPTNDVVVRRNGVSMAQLQYQSAVASELQWTAKARNFGAFVQRMHHFPGSVSRLWWPNPQGGLDVFNLAAGARTVPETVLDEWVDALTAQKLRRNDHSYDRLVSQLELSARTERLVESAVRNVKDAEQNQVSDVQPPFREARRLEDLLGPADELGSNAPPVSPDASAECPEGLPLEPDPYEACKQELLRKLNQDDPSDEQ